MMRHDWPGNVRELENAVERACALSSGPVLHLGDLPTQLQQQGSGGCGAPPAAAGEGIRGRRRAGVKTLAELEREAILGAIRTLNGDKLQAPGCWASARPRSIASSRSTASPTRCSEE